jgi:hypothetical protein
MMILRETVEFEVTRRDLEKDLLFVEFKVYHIRNEFSLEQLDVVIDKEDVEQFEIWTETSLAEAEEQVFAKIEKIVESKQRYGYLPETEYVIMY